MSAIFSDDGLDEFFGNGELSPTFFENEILLSPNAATVWELRNLLFHYF